MKIVNRTKYSRKVLRHLASVAAWRVPKLNRKNCTVEFISGKQVRGIAQRNECKVYVPSRRFVLGYVSTAQQVFRTTVHELKHISDSQNCLRFGDYNKKWANRPHEQRAIKTTEKAARFIEDNIEVQDAILSVAIEFENQKQSWYEKKIMRGYTWREWQWSPKSTTIIRFWQDKIIEYFANHLSCGDISHWSRRENKIEDYDFDSWFVRYVTQ